MNQAKDDKTPGGSYAVMRYVATQWVELMLRIMQNALSPHHLQDIDSMECAEDVLTTHLRFLISVLKQLDEFAQIFRHFPWRFRLLFDQVPAVVESTLKQMREEWEFLMVIEQNTVLHGKYPLNQMPFLRWYVYREVMTLAEERGWVASQDLVDLAKAWFSDPCSTLGCEDSFRALRMAEARHQNNKEVCPEKLQALTIKSINERYKEFELAELKSSDYHGVRPGTYMKRSVFDCSRASANDTGIANFNQIMKTTTVSPHHLSRKSLSMWEAYKMTNGNSQNWWTAQLVRSHQAGSHTVILSGAFLRFFIH